MKKFLTYCSFCLLLSACEREIQIAEIPYRERIVINAVLSNTEPMSFYIGRSVASLSDSAPGGLTNAVVQLFRDEVLQTTPIYNPFTQKYESNDTARSGSNYRIVVRDPRLGQATASARVPNDDSFVSFEYIDSVGLDSIGGILAGLRFKLNDPSNERNYYRIYLEYWNQGLQSFLPLRVITNDDVLLSPTTTRNPDGSYLFNDDLFANRQKTFSVEFSASDITGSPKVRFTSESWTEDLFRYQRSVERYEENQSNPFSDPVVIFSNITNGLGILGAKTSKQEVIF